MICACDWINQRKLLNIESEILPGRKIDLTLFSVIQGNFTYCDTEGGERAGGKRILPVYTLINGNLVSAGERDSELLL